MSCVFECDGGAAVSHHEVANHAYRIAQEAVNNAMKHASARRLWIRLAHAGGRVRLCVEDDGVGLRSREGRNEGMGLRIMEYRARLIGAALEIGPRDGGGVRVVCEFSGAPPEIAG
ncbi:MAG: Nitrate/nitrite sensor protein NarX [candidate division BRC1 bacterium ADurb.BinA364]|nr:MAG: Nitrate/nitrite sensor protein NarX [candidate division BRC1 bacterium ADurb.BinA364]